MAYLQNEVLTPSSRLSIIVVVSLQSHPLTLVSLSSSLIFFLTDPYADGPLLGLCSNSMRPPSPNGDLPLSFSLRSTSMPFGRTDDSLEFSASFLTKTLMILYGTYLHLNGHSYIH